MNGKHFNDGSHARGPLLLAAGKILFGTTALAVRLIPLHPLIFVLTLNGFAVIAFSRGWRDLKTALRKKMWLIVLVSLAFVVQDVAYYAAVKAMDVSVATLVRWVAPIFVVSTTFLIGERVTRRAVFPALMAFLGLVIILTERGIEYGTTNATGIAFSLLSALTVAIYWMGAKVALKEIQVRALILLRSTVACIVLIPLVAIGFREETRSALAFLPYLVGFGVLYGILAAYLDTRGIQETTARQMAVLGYLVPLTTIIGSVVVLGEQLTPALIVGGIMVIAGGYLARA